MEKEGGSTSPVYVAAAATWASWAVGAVTAKFYKAGSSFFASQQRSLEKKEEWKYRKKKGS